MVSAVMVNIVIIVLSKVTAELVDGKILRRWNNVRLHAKN